MHQVISLDPSQYKRHIIHSQERDWAETNCYVDIWIELLSAMGHEPLAALPFTLAIDFEGDQWTFFKFPLSDLFDIYKLDVQELALWQPLLTHIDTQVKLGRPVLVELDSYHLPDTAGTAYQLNHVKSTVAIVEIDIEKEHMGYFHGQAYYYLENEDFINVFKPYEKTNTAILPPYAEIVKSNSSDKYNQQQTLAISLGLLKKQLRLIPEINPFTKFKQKFIEDFEWLKQQDLDTFHQYSFATFRQFGACFELASNYLSWLTKQGESDLLECTNQIKSISELAKIYQFQLARSISRGKPLDITAIDTMSENWQLAMSHLKFKYL